MKRRSAFVIPAIAAVLAAAIVALVGPFNSPVTRAQSSLAFQATFDTPSDFFDRFDFGLSGVAQSDITPQGAVNYHGDHDSACEGPTTLRDVNLTGSGTAVDYSQMVWWCAPKGPASGHIMTGLNTFGYNHLWFSPKPTFTQITKVCWDVNETTLSSRKWTELQFVDDADAHKYPTGSLVDSGVYARGTGGFDLGYTDIGFRGGTNSGPTTGLVPSGGLAGLKDFKSVFSYFVNDTQGMDDQVGWPGNLGNGDPAGTDKATRYTHCLSNNPDGTTMTLAAATPTNPGRTLTVKGQIPQDARRVVFHDSTYDAPKGDDYNPDFLTWHWDNIQVFTDSDTPPTTTPPTTTPPTTTPPTTTPPTTTPPTTTPPTTTPPTTTPPTTTPPTTTPPTTEPPTTEPPTTMPPTTEPPTTEPPTTMPPTTEPPTTEPPTTMPPTTEPPTTEPPTTMPPTTEPPPTTTPPTTNVPGAPVVTIMSGPDQTTTDPNAEIVFQVLDPSTGEFKALPNPDITCSLDGQAAEPCSSPVRYEGLELGNHTVEIKAIDGVGGEGSANYSWAVVASASANPADPTAASQPPASTTPSVQRAVLSFTGAHITELVIFGLMLIGLGLALGSVAAVSRRRSS